MSKFIKVASVIPALLFVAACAQQEEVVAPVQLEPVYDKYGVATYVPATAAAVSDDSGGGGAVVPGSDDGVDGDDSGQNRNQNRTENQNTNENQTSNSNQNQNQSGN